jgi:hypothetical protein
MGGVEPALRLTSETLLGNPDGALCEAAKMEDDDDGASTAAAGVGDAEGVVDLAKGDDPKTDVAFAWSPKFDKTGVDVDAPKGEKDEFEFAFPDSRKLDTTSAVEPEALGTEEVDVDPKAGVEVCPKNAEEVVEVELPPPNAELLPKLRLPPKTFGVVLRFANAEAAGGTEFGAEECGAAWAVSDVGIEDDPKAETGGGAGDVPKAEVDDELAPSMTEGEGLTPKVPVSHSVALGFSGWGWC